MDARKLGASFAAVAALAVASVVFDTGGDPVPASYRGGYYGEVGGTYATQDLAIEEVNLLYRSTVNPPTAAVTAGYIGSDSEYTIKESADGTHLKYGYILRTAPTTKQGGSDRFLIAKCQPEDDHNFVGQTQYITFLWFSLDGLDEYSKIENAFLYCQSQATPTTVSGQAWYVRADTVTADFEMLESVTPTADAARLGITWNSVDPDDAGGAVAWSPTLDSRDDWHDFGPRSLAMPDTTMGAGATYYFDVTDPIQQILNNGNPGRGVIFVAYGTHAQNTFIFAGGSHGTVAGWGGNPALVVKASKRHEPDPWGGVRQPVAMIFDDNKAEDPTLATLTTALGEKYVTASYKASWESDSEDNDAMDSLVTALWPDDMVILPHSRTHTTFGGLTAGERADELEREWLVGKGLSAEITAADTLLMKDWVWVGGEPKPIMVYDAVRQMQNFGYRSARSDRYGVATVIGEATRCSWDQYVNRYNVAALQAITMFQASTTTEATDEIFDEIDIAYTEHGRSAVILYVHGFESSANATANYAAILGAVQGASYADLMPHDELMGLLTSRRIVDLDEVIANGDAVSAAVAQQWKTAATTNDSLGLVNYWDSIFVAPGSNQ